MIKTAIYQNYVPVNILERTINTLKANRELTYQSTPISTQTLTYTKLQMFYGVYTMIIG
jgi:hypothetical protein